MVDVLVVVVIVLSLAVLVGMLISREWREK